MLKSKYNIGVIEAGCDEAGRGCLSGPVVAAAVILPDDFYHPLLNDSKKISEKNREILREIILNEAISYGIGEVSHTEIDTINILNASFLAMHKAIEQLKIIPEHLIIDGNRFKPYEKIPHTCIVKGDSKYASIAAASILAKTARDKIMTELHEKFPHYGWNENKGYATATHREAILKNGPCEFHRRSFTLIPVQYSFNF